MNQAAILYPVAALALLTLSVLILIPYHRFKASFAKKVSAHDFKYGESSRVPPEVSIPNRHLMNLLELPVLFYIACLTMFVTHRVYNRVTHRLGFFALSSLVLVVIWLRVLLSLSSVSA
jgi:hypothetical protein